MIKETELEKYCGNIEKVLEDNQIEKAKILKTVKCDIEEFLEEHPDAAMEDLVKRFGIPEDYAKEYAFSLDSGELAQKLNVVRFRKKAIMIGVTVAVAIVLFVAVLVIRNNTRNSSRYYEEVIVYGTTSAHEEVP